LPLGKEPMLWHPVRQLVGSGIDEILVVTSTHHMGSVVQSLASGKRFGCEFIYRVQEEAQGIAHALALAKAFLPAGGSSFCSATMFSNIRFALTSTTSGASSAAHGRS
jgi:glucose-1-phosphate thymidylyltransferase